MAAGPDRVARPRGREREGSGTARRLGLSLNGLTLALQRGELAGLFSRVGSAEELGRFCRGAGIGDLQGLLAFLGGDGEARP